jgi:ABC-type Fe3+/spermidine/putrescine transport system ATPase subunit
MNAGVIEQVGSPRDLYEKPANRFVAGFIGETNFIEGTITGVWVDGITVETPIGIILSRASPEFQVGNAVVCSIRPEAIDVLAQKVSGCENVFECTVESFMYLGDNEQYQLRMKDNRIMKAMVRNVSGMARKKGESVWISVQAKNVVLLRGQ